MNEELVLQISVWVVPVLVAVIFHEVAHGWVASRLGDTTAARMGRLTLNPISHIDLFGTVLVPLFLILVRAPFLFGYAKPVPVNFYNLRHPKRDMIWVALAGPVTNILLAATSAYVFRFMDTMGGVLPTFLTVPFTLMAEKSIYINVALAAFNLLPLPPLDGGRVLVGLLPQPYSSIVARIEPFGFLIIVILLMTHTLDIILSPVFYLVIRFLMILAGQS
jgi:Zn-dependent protease